MPGGPGWLALCRIIHMATEHWTCKVFLHEAECYGAGVGSWIKDGQGTSVWQEDIWAGM